MDPSHVFTVGQKGLYMLLIVAAALLLAVLAAVLLFGLKLGLARTLAVSAAAGLLLSFLPV